MQYRRLGKTGAIVSVLGFGMMRLPLLPGGDNTRIDEEKATTLINHAIDNGVNYFDTAYVYHSNNAGQAGESEPFLGKALAGKRERLMIATKLPMWLLKTEGDMDRYLDEQLKRLQTDYIDFYLLHNINDKAWETAKKLNYKKFLDKAIADGRIKFAGFSFHEKYELFPEVIDDYDWSFCQIQYNYMDTEYQAGRRGLHYAAEKDIGVIVMEPLRGGGLAANLPPEVEAIYKPTGRSAASWALRWVFDQQQVSMLLSGMNEMQQLEENLESTAHTPDSMTEADLARIEQAADVFRSKIKIPCTSCAYCMPCPFGVNIPGAFAAYNNHFMFSAPKELYTMHLGPSERASCCTECGVCETHCPQSIQIRDELKTVNAFFEG